MTGHVDGSRTQADRMIALWRTVSNPDMSTEELIYAILGEGARGIRDGVVFSGTLLREDGGDIVIEALIRRGTVRSNLPKAGDRIPFADTMESALAPHYKTRAWPDVQSDPAVAALPFVIKAGIRAAIVAPFSAGRSTYFLRFSSRRPLAEPFAPDDFAYVELLAQFFSARLQQAWQLDRITYQLAHDSLTGLRNRTQFRIDARAALGTNESGTMAVVSIDGFRHVNETYGHIIGDALLVEVGAALGAHAHEGDVVGRLAGDTFGVFIPGVNEATSARERLAAYALAFSKPFGTGDREGKEAIPLGATIGADIAVDTSASIDSLLSHADTAVFAAKRLINGRGRTVFFEPNMESQETARNRLLSEIALALTRNEFELYFQPHVELATRRVSGAEALIRWNHPTRGLTMPEAFIPFAEANGSIRAISMWVVRAALDAAQLLRAIDPDFRLYFNLSALDLSDLAVVHEMRAAARRGLHLENVGVEVTETAAMQDLGLTLQTVKAIQELGVRVAIDDFGTGYSSLALLKRLPVDSIKIDRSFIGEVLAGDHDAAITESVIGFGHRFGFETVGEGVETEAQFAWLRERGCGYAQGYLISPPLPYHVFLPWLFNYIPPLVA